MPTPAPWLAAAQLGSGMRLGGAGGCVAAACAGLAGRAACLAPGHQVPELGWSVQGPEKTKRQPPPAQGFCWCLLAGRRARGRAGRERYGHGSGRGAVTAAGGIDACGCGGRPRVCSRKGQRWAGCGTAPSCHFVWALRGPGQRL